MVCHLRAMFEFRASLFPLLAALGLAACDDETSNPPVEDVAQETGGDTGEDPVDEPTPDVPPEVNDTTPDATGDPLPDLVPDVADTSDAGPPDAPPEDFLRVAAVSPERGPTEGGTEILIVGLGFTFDSDVYLGGVLCENIDVVDDTRIFCDTPPNPAGAYDVKVVNDVDLASLAAGFTYFAPVEIDSLEPARGPTSGGMPVTLTGAGFTASTQVSIGGRMGLGIEFISENTVRLLTPPGLAGLADVRVSNENGLGESLGAFEYFEPVLIEQILPGAGLAAGGEDVRIIGAGFTEDLAIRFGLLEADVEGDTDSERRVTTPAGPSNDAVDVSALSTENGEFTLTDGFFYFTPTGALQLVHVMPRTGSTAGGDVVVLSGEDLAGVEEVNFGTAEADILEAADGYVIVEAPAHAAGAVDIEVVDGGASDTLDDAFTYVAAIDLDAIDPAEGDIDGGTAITITGENFTAGTTVRIGALAATDVEVVSGTQITAITPPGPIGLADVVLQSPQGLRGVLEDGFLYTDEVQVFGLSPARGALAGGTYVVIRGAGFVEPLAVEFCDTVDGAGVCGGRVEAIDVDILDAATVAIRTPPHAPGFATVRVQVGDGTPVAAAERFLYYDPASGSGGSWGDGILGSVNVTVLSENGAPLPDAFVMLDVREEAQFFGYTDANGQVTLSGPDLSGAQTVTATRVGFSNSTVQSVDAENITVILSCIPENVCGGTGDCRDGFVCTCGPPFAPFGICLVDQFCGFEPQTQEEFDAACTPQGQPIPFGVITGQLTGVHKVDDPGPGERIMGIVSVTRPHPFAENPISPGTGNVLNDDGPYTVRSRLGEVAVIGLCGVYNENTDTFTPRFMGVRRGLFIVDAETYEVDIDCNIEMNQVITIKAVNPPFAPSGPDRFIFTPYLHLGSEGYFGGSQPYDNSFRLGPLNITGTADTLSGNTFAPLEGELAGLDYYVVGGAYTGANFPESVTVKEGITNVDETIVLPEFIPVPQLTTPRDGGELVDRYLEWSLETDARPDFYFLLLVDYAALLQGAVIIYWDVLVPGDQNTVNLPFYPEDAETGIFPAATMLLQIQAVDAITFDYDNFDNFNNFNLGNWRAWSVNVFLVTNPF